jgi:tripartite-type tricarboxylate transporter receptor subunit TctC
MLEIHRHPSRGEERQSACRWANIKDKQHGGCNMFRAHAVTIIFALGSLGWVAPSTGQDYPSRPLKMIVPLPPGGGSDLMARFSAQMLTPRLGQSVVVENKAGGGSVIGVDLVAKAKPDGYTILWTASDGLSIAPALRTTPYKVPDDFSFIARISDFSYIITVNPKLPIHTLADLIAYAKANPGKLRYGTAGIGSGPHLATELVAGAAGIDMLHVPYVGIGPAITAAMGGFIDVILAAPTIKQHTDAGSLRAIAMTGKERHPDFPNVPTLTQAGLPNLVVTIWWGMLAPAGTAEPILARLRNDTAEMMKDPKTLEGLRKLGYEPSYLPHDAFKEFVMQDIERWKAVAKKANIKLTD